MKGKGFWMIVLSVLAADRMTKELAAGIPAEGVTLIPGVLGLRYAENRGIAFSLLSGYPRLTGALSLALMLESHLDTVAELFPAEDAPSGRKSKLRKYAGTTPAADARRQSCSCFVCSRVAGFEEKYLDNTVHLWKKDPAFRDLFAAQPWFCLNHYAGLLDQGQQQLSEDSFSGFQAALNAIMARYIKQLREDVTGFCRTFDYRSGSTPMTEDQRTAVPRAADFLSGRRPKA